VFIDVSLVAGLRIFRVGLVSQLPDRDAFLLAGSERQQSAFDYLVAFDDFMRAREVSALASPGGRRARLCKNIYQSLGKHNNRSIRVGGRNVRKC
jgi:hypothetical protein